MHTVKPQVYITNKATSISSKAPKSTIEKREIQLPYARK